MRLAKIWLTGVALGLFAQIDPVAAQPPPGPDGGAIYHLRCASCHDADDGHAPSRDALGRRSPVNIKLALRTGAMKLQGANLGDAEISAISAFLTADVAARAPPVNLNPCPTAQAPILLSEVGWNGWGRDSANSRYQPQPKLRGADVARLSLAWTFAFPGAQTWGQPTVMGGRVFVADTVGGLYALDAKTGCTVWKADLAAPTRGSLTIGPGWAGGPRAVAYFGDQAAEVHALDANTGRALWSTKVDDHPHARLTAAPALAGGRLLVPVSSIEEAVASAPGYPCCTFRGSVAALDIHTGRVLWKTWTIGPAPKPYRRKTTANSLFGPAGAAIWNTPTIDARRGVAYVGTGNNYTDIEVPTTDAIMALDLVTGKVRWSRQVSPQDHWTTGCTYGTACPDNAGPDYDFGASPILISLPSGRDVLVAGQKSGVVYGLDPAAKGRILWKTRLGTGSSQGGVEWGMAASGRRLFVPISNSRTEPASAARPGLGAIDAASGQVLWWAAAPRAVCAWGTAGCRAAQAQAASAMPGVVFSGGQDGVLRAYDAGTGKVLWAYDTTRDVHPVNATTATGGSLDLGGPAIADGMVFVNSGYGQIIGRGGNVLLAFRVAGQ